MAVEFPVQGQVRTMRTEFQIAQKIHAITMPEPPGHPLRYARHVVDVLYLAGTGVDQATIAAACQAVFDARSAKDGRTWPPDAIILPERWIADYAVTLSGYGMTLPAEAVPSAFMTFITSLIGGVVPVLGYEYQFVSLAATPVGDQSAALAGPIESRGMAYDHFTQLAANGWRVVSMCPNPRGGSNVLLVLEREIVSTE